MNQGNSNGRGLGSVVVPVAVLHAVCCGGLLLALLLGSAGFTVIAAFFQDPLIQAAGLIGAAALALWAWRRHKASLARRTTRTLPPSTDEDAEADIGWRP